MKKLLALLLALTMVLALSACGGGSAPASEQAPAADADTIVIGVYEPLSGDNGEPNAVEDSRASEPARDSAPVRNTGRPRGGEQLERLFLLLLIYILSREKGDPCLIAALLYVLL